MPKDVAASLRGGATGRGPRRPRRQPARVSFARRLRAGLLSLLLIQACRVATAQQPPPSPGPGPIPPGSGPQQPTQVFPPGKAIEVPIGRQEAYDEEKRKAGETPVVPPGAEQEDPALRRRVPEPDSQLGR